MMGLAFLVSKIEISAGFCKKKAIFERNPENPRRQMKTGFSIRDARPEDAPFLARCIMAGMHFYDFETDIPAAADLYERLVVCERREDLLYSYRYTRVAESEGVPAGSLLSYPGAIYRELRHRTFRELWPELARMDAESDMETDPGEYYLDSLAVHPSFRRRGIGRALLQDGIREGERQGFRKIALVADSGMPHLIRLYASLGFKLADRRHVFGVDFQRMVYEGAALISPDSPFPGTPAV